MKRTPLAKQSKKRKSMSAPYSRLWSSYMLKHPFCEFPFCTNQSKDIHHKSGRIGKNLIDTRTWAAVCRPCHDWIHNNGRLARKLKWIR